MFENSEQLFEFIENTDELIMDQVLEGTVVDSCMYEGEYMEKALTKYIEMLESDKVDEEFEANLSNVLVPYLSSSAAVYENLIEEGKVSDLAAAAGKKISGVGKKIAATARLKKMGYKGRLDVARFKAGQKMSSAKETLKGLRAKYGPKALAQKLAKGLGTAKKWAGEKFDKIKTAVAAGMNKVTGANRRKRKSFTTGANNPALRPAT